MSEQTQTQPSNVNEKDVTQGPQLSNVKEHQLQTEWSFWYSKKTKKTDEKNFDEALHLWGSFTTVEGFYKHYAYLKKPSDLSKDHNLTLFREKVQPTWESYPDGLSFLIKLKKKDEKLNVMWEEILFAAIGEAFSEPDVAGVGVAIRAKYDAIYLWTKDMSNERLRESVRNYLEETFCLYAPISLIPGGEGCSSFTLYATISYKLRQILGLDDSLQIEYKAISTSIRDRSSFRLSKPFLPSEGDSPATKAATSPPVSSGKKPSSASNRSSAPSDKPPSTRSERRSANRDPREGKDKSESVTPSAPVVEIIYRKEEAPPKN